MSYYSYYNFKRRKIMLVYDFRTIGNTQESGTYTK